MIFAEASNGFMGALMYALLALIGGIAAAFGIYFGFREPKTQRTRIADQPVEIRKAPKRYNHDLAEERYQEVTRRLDAHDEEISAIQRSRAESMEKINCKFERVLVALTEIGAHVGVKSKRD